MQQQEMLGFDNVTTGCGHNIKTKTYIQLAPYIQRVICEYALLYKNLPILVCPYTVRKPEDLGAHNQYLSKQAQKSITFVNKPYTFYGVNTNFK
jgi:hypothetical protein